MQIISILRYKKMSELSRNVLHPGVASLLVIFCPLISLLHFLPLYDLTIWGEEAKEKDVSERSQICFCICHRTN